MALKRLLGKIFRRREIRPDFYTPIEKQVSRERLDAFWKDFEAGKRVTKRLTPIYGREVVAVSPAMLGTIRRFESEAAAKEYIKKSSALFNAIKQINPKNFDLQPIQFLDRKGPNLLERVYLAPNIADLMLERGRYFNKFMRRMGSKGVSYLEVKIASHKAFGELDEITFKRQIQMDFNPANFLVLDYDPKTRKVLFGLVDIGGSITSGYHEE